MDDTTQKLIQVGEKYWDSFLLTLPKLVLGIVVFVIAIFIAFKIGRLARTATRNKVQDQLLANFVGRLTKWALIVAGIILTMYVVGLGGIAAGLVAGAGISAFVIGFAFKDIGENFLAGILLAFSRPFGVGDTVESNEIIGKVESLDMRNTHIKTFDGKDVFIPNAMIVKTPLVNYTRDGYIRYDFVVGIDYDDNIAKTEQLIVETLKNVEGVLSEGEREPFVVANELAVSTVNLKIHFWLDTMDFKKSALQTQSRAISAVKEALLDNNIVLPADILELKIYNEKLPIPVRLIDKVLSKNNNEE